MTIRVLLVDDEPQLRLLLRTQLELHGSFQVVAEAESVASVMDVTRDVRPELVVLDLNLIDGDAGSLVQEIRATSPSTVVVVLSAQSGDDRAAGVLRDGAHAYYEKRPGTIRQFPIWLAQLHGELAYPQAV